MNETSAAIGNAALVPRTNATRRALQLMRAAAPIYLVNHCLRSYAFGVSLAERDGQSFARETLAVAAILHDIGLARRYRTGRACFEVRGADVAAAFLVANGWRPHRIAVVREAIIAHMRDGEAPSPEARVLDAGISYDVSGRRHEEIDAATRSEILRAYPRRGFKRHFIATFRREAAAFPGCAAAILMSEQDLEARVLAAPFDS